MPMLIIPYQQKYAIPKCDGINHIHHLSNEEKIKFKKTSDKIINGNAKFWKIEKEGIKPSYVLRTIHVLDTDITTLHDNVISALDNSDHLLLVLGKIVDNNLITQNFIRDPDFFV
ncbi:TraB/GumN family protein [Bartonella tamiae]|uniref:Uncharacterized protein n=1 Tax=Bartonella tamiae Th239 TaxID=1094558 RepID=J0ZS75_9HYPH|nr:TraB/GumN family protein [Bartonella tamiae]EJF91593.1 hypothetical protein ME5_00288 [Bartonella tamiae Th239]EJF92423.1 hypothetical protein MEG_01593 [Bartonella tamiae Th307]